MFDFIFDAPVKIYYGDQLSSLGSELKQYGKNVLLTYGGGSIKKIGLYDRIVREIKGAGLNLFELSGIEPNPKIDSVRKGAQMCKDYKIDVVLACGGGSTIDASKGICAGAMVDFDPWKFYTGEEVIKSAIPLVTILTNSATGSEMNVNSVVSNPETNDKYGTKGRACLPRASFLNPEHTFSVSPYTTACGAADIISHIFEVYFNTNPDLYMLDRVMESLIETVIKFAPIAMNEPTNYQARSNLMWASTWALNGFIRGGKKCDWSCHPIEHELSAFYDIPHGLGLAILTPRWLKYALNEKTVDRYVSLGVNVFKIDSKLEKMEIAKKVIEKMEEFLFSTLKLESSLSQINIDKTHFEIMAKKACKFNVINGFIQLYPADVEKILEISL